MLGLIALLISITVAVGGHISSRNFTYRRLRFTRVAERPGISGVLAGVGVAVLAAPLMAILPLVGAGTAMLLGAGVGTGVSLGVRGPAHDPSY